MDPKTAWDSRYAHPVWAYGDAPNDFLVSVADRIPPGPVLCLAEGQGRNAIWLATRGHPVTAVDVSPVGLAGARDLAAERGVTVTTVEADLAHYVIEPGAWAGVVAIWCHLPRDLRRVVFGQAVAGLRPGGAFVLESYTPRQLEHRTGGPPVVEMLVEPEDLRAELTGLRLEILREIEREVHEGRLHNGRSAVVQALGFAP